jgi:hypothetical protein
MMDPDRIAMGKSGESATVPRRRIFLSYKHSPAGQNLADEVLAMKIHDSLAAHHQVFIDRKIEPGENWAKRIDRELRAADYLIPLLSADSVTSEMVMGEIEKAHHLAKERNGRPGIIPIRIAYPEAFPYPLSCYLNHIQWAFWETDQDTEKLLRQVGNAVAGLTLGDHGRPAEKAGYPPASEAAAMKPLPAASLEIPGGAMSEQSGFYVERPADAAARAVIGRRGVTLTIKGARQMGKSSLLVRCVEAARKCHKTVALLDFQLLGKESLASAEIFAQHFCSWVTAVLNLDDAVSKSWNRSLPVGISCTNYFGKHVIPKLERPLVLAIDEADRIAEFECSSDFYGMLRGWHNMRANDSMWSWFDLVLSASTEPYSLISNPSQSPFNIGAVIELDELTADHIADLNGRHGAPLREREQKRLMNLVGGQPYLVRRALYLIASGLTTASALFRDATEDRGPFGDHLRYHLMRLHTHANLARGLSQAIEDGRIPDETVAGRLQGAGLVRKKGLKTVPRCKLYADYFRTRLNV